MDAYIKKGLFTSLYGKWRRRFGRVFRIVPDESLAYLQYRVVDSERNELSLVDEKDNGKSSVAKTADKAIKRGAEEEEPQPAKKEQPKPQGKQAKVQKEQPAQTPTEQPAESTDAPEQPAPKAKKPKQRQAKKKAEPQAQTDPAHLLPPAEQVMEDVPGDMADESGDAQEISAGQPKPKPKRRHRRKPKPAADGQPSAQDAPPAE